MAKADTFTRRIADGAKRLPGLSTVARLSDGVASAKNAIVALEARLDVLLQNQQQATAAQQAAQATLDRLDAMASSNAMNAPRVLDPVAFADAEVAALLAASRVVRASRNQSAGGAGAHPLIAPLSVDLDADLERLRGLDPETFDVWLQLFENGKRSYVEQRSASCSHQGNLYARVFAAFLDVYAKGRLLDIGCGPFGCPAYAADYPRDQFAGLDPLPQEATADFVFAQAFNEFLPWPDASFETVVSATSLDHVLSLETSLREVRRVLVPGGAYLVWLASIPGAPAFEPRRKDVTAIDDYHLFHFDSVWIEPLFDRYFRIAERLVVPQPGFDHVFYKLVAPDPPRADTA